MICDPRCKLREYSRIRPIQLPEEFVLSDDNFIILEYIDDPPGCVGIETKAIGNYGIFVSIAARRKWN